jgi:hypothetical protein
VRPTTAREADRPAIGTKPGRQNIPTIDSAAPGRHRPATVSPIPACPRTAALRLALCPSLRVSSFSFVLQLAHLPAFHSHFLTAHNTGTVFLKFFFESHFLLSFLPWNVRRARFPVPDDDGFKFFTSLVQCASHSTSSSIQIQERLER